MNENKWIKHDRPEGSTIPISWYNDVCAAGLTFSAQIIAYNHQGNGPYTVKVGVMSADMDWQYEYHDKPVRVLNDAITLARVMRRRIEYQRTGK